MYNWKLQHFISPLNLLGLAFWKHKFLTEAVDRVFGAINLADRQNKAHFS